MKKKVLIIDTKTKNLKSLSPIFNELKNRNYEIIIASTCKDMKNVEDNCTWSNITIPKIFNLNNRFQLFLFLIISPITILLSFFFLLFIKFSKKINTIYCCHYQEKICLTRLAKLLKINIIWLEFPEIVNEKRKKTLNHLLKTRSKLAKIIVFTKKSKDILNKQGYKLENIHLITPAIKQKSLQRQESIFDGMAHQESNSKKRKFFTIGIISELNNKKINDKMEKLFQAIKKSLVIIPDIQIIVVGEGEDRKNLGWLTKRMEIDNLVWFVGGPTLPETGSQKHLKKWLDSFDLLISVCDNIDINDLNTIVYAMKSQLPIICPENIGFETLLEHNITGSLINTDDSENITQEIIRMQQNKKIRHDMGKNASEKAQNEFTIENVTNHLVELMK
jgi:glycosyltransferase involved in cell wall biosynthesis